MIGWYYDAGEVGKSPNNYTNPSRFGLDLEIDLQPSPSLPE
jgi:hypothetical protein